MRVAAPPVDGSVQILPCRSMASVRPSGETATDMDVPSLTVTSMGVRLGAASSAAASTTSTISSVVRHMGVLRAVDEDRCMLYGPEGLDNRVIGSLNVSRLVGRKNYIPSHLVTNGVSIL